MRSISMIARSYDYALEVVRTWRPDMQQLQAALHSIATLPVLLLWGAEDQVVSPALRAAVARVLSRRRIRGAAAASGHLPYEEAPEEFNRRVLHFLET